MRSKGTPPPHNNNEEEEEDRYVLKMMLCLTRGSTILKLCCSFNHYIASIGGMKRATA
jgi:hypothetical protein